LQVPEQKYLNLYFPEKKYFKIYFRCETKISFSSNHFRQLLLNDVHPGLPDGLFSNQKSQIWVNFGGPLIGKN
jgi:hypothetical protein